MTVLDCVRRIKALRLVPVLFVALLVHTGRAEVPALTWRSPGAAGSRTGDILTVCLDRPGHAMFHADVDLTPWTGKILRATIRSKGSKVVRARESWLGYKFMFHYRDEATGQDVWPGAPCWAGDWDWRTSEVRVDLRAAKPGKGRLSLGLQDTSGTVSFDLSTLTFEEVKPLFMPDTDTTPCVYTDRVRRRPTGRGVMLPGGPCKEDDFRTLQAWGANLARYQMIRGWHERNNNQDPAEYLHWVDGKIDHLLNDVLPWAERYGIDIVVDLHVPPGGREEGGDMNMFYNRLFADTFLAAWTNIATRCQGQPRIWGYDLINEPSQSRAALPECDYWTLQARAAKAVRAIDPVTPIILESNGWDAPAQFRVMKRLDLPDIIYQSHMYEPGTFTHQGVHGSSEKDWKRLAYPSEGLDRARLKRALQPVLDFQKRHQAIIYIGEFSAISWAEGADRYIADVINLLEENGWHWTYHAFREWEGWSVEHEATGWRKMRPSADNPRKRALLKGLSNR